MPHIQGGVRLKAADAAEIRTKKALRDLAADRPDQVVFYTTSELHPKRSLTLDTLRQGETLIAVGPDPRTKRSWYATIQRLSTGKLHVS